MSAAVAKMKAGAGARAKPTKAPAPKRRTLAGTETPPGVPRLLFSVEEASYALGIRKRKTEELIARGPEHGGIFSLKIGGRRLVPLWALEQYTRPPTAGAI